MKKFVNLIYRYGFFGVLKLICFYLRTKLLFPKARIIRFPFEVRGKNQIQIGVGFTTGVGCRLEVISNDYSSKEKKIVIGDNVQINDYVHIGAAEKVVIEENVLIASKVFITDHSHGNYSGENCDSPDSIPVDRKIVSSGVTIKRNVWIGEFVSILPGVTIGEGSIIGTMSVVNKDIPSFSIAVGSPARVIKKYYPSTRTWEKTGYIKS